MERKLSRNEKLKEEYNGIIEEQLRAGVTDKPVVKLTAVTTKVRMVFDASARPHPLANSINDCMFTGPHYNRFSGT